MNFRFKIKKKIKLKQNKNVFFLSPSLWPIFELEISFIKEHFKRTDEIHLINCEKSQNYCPANNLQINNFKKTTAICNWCQSRYESGISWLSNSKFKILKKSFVNLNNNQKLEIEKLNDFLKSKNKYDKNTSKFFKKYKINYEELLQSSVSCEERLSSVNLNNYYYKKIVLITNNILISYFSALNHLREIKPKKIYIFNGRDNTYRPIYLAAKRIVKKENIFVYEFPDVAYESIKIVNKNYPHDLEHHSKEMFKNFKKVSSSIDKKKINIKGKKIIKNRMMQNFNTFVAWRPKQKIGILPDNFEKNKFNLSIFTSSEYEVRNIPENESKISYGSQFKLIDRIASEIKNLKKDIEIYVRLHPSQINDLDIFKELCKKYNFLKILSPSSKVSSYTLGLESDLNIVFHSTIGLELSALRSNVLIIGPTMYQDFKVSKMYFNINKLIKELKKYLVKNEVNIKTNQDNAFQAMYAFEVYLKKLKFVKKNTFRVAKLFSKGKFTKLNESLFYKYIAYGIFSLRKTLKLINIKL